MISASGTRVATLVPFLRYCWPKQRGVSEGGKRWHHNEDCDRYRRAFARGDPAAGFGADAGRGQSSDEGERPPHRGLPGSLRGLEPDPVEPRTRLRTKRHTLRLLLQSELPILQLQPLLQSVASQLHVSVANGRQRIYGH